MKRIIKRKRILKIKAFTKQINKVKKAKCQKVPKYFTKKIFFLYVFSISGQALQNFFNRSIFTFTHQARVHITSKLYSHSPAFASKTAALTVTSLSLSFPGLNKYWTIKEVCSSDKRSSLLQVVSHP